MPFMVRRSGNEGLVLRPMTNQSPQCTSYCLDYYQTSDSEGMLHRVRVNLLLGKVIGSSDVFW